MTAPSGRVANPLLKVIEETVPCRRACDSCAIVLERRSPVANDRPGDLCGPAGRAYD